MHRKFRTISAMLLIAACLMALAACGGTSVEQASPSPTVTPTAAPQPDSLSLLRETMEPSAALSGVLYLGYYPELPLTESLYADLAANTALADFVFLQDIPLERAAIADGGELYCIIPADPNAAVQVNFWDGMTDAEGELLYQANSGDPFWAVGNASDIMPNLSITITNAFGQSLSQYHPFISLRDGYLQIPTEGEAVVLDLTPEACYFPAD